ncbi:MAG: MFS transporter [Candidatus Heimdallarchaeota archaeon]
MKEKTKALLQLVFVLLVNTLIILAGAAITPIIQEMKDAFPTIPNIDLVAELILSVTSISIAVGAIFIGFIIDKFGRKKVLVITTLLNAVFGTIGFYAGNIYVILVSRIFLGFAVAGIMTSITALIGDFYEGEKRNQVLGLRSMFTSFGGAVFTIVGGALGGISWNYAFLVYFVSLLFLPGVMLFIPEPDRKSKIEEEEIKQTSDVNVADKDEKTGGFPVKIGILSYSLILISMVIFYFIAVQLSSYFPEYGENREIIVGLALGMSGLTSGIAALSFKYVKRILNTHWIFITTLLTLGCGFILLALAPVSWVIFIAVGIVGFGWGLFMPNIQAWLLLHTPTRLRGRVVGIFVMMLYLGQFISPFVAFPIRSSIDLSGLFLVGGIMLFVLLVVPIVLLTIDFVNKKKETEELAGNN